MMGIVDGTVPLPVPPGETGATTATNHMVNRVESDGFKTKQKPTLGVLEQLIEEGGYTIGSLLFTTVEESISYRHRHFP